jgi:hypothetical protein
MPGQRGKSVVHTFRVLALLISVVAVTWALNCLRVRVQLPGGSAPPRLNPKLLIKHTAATYISTRPDTSRQPRWAGAGGW